MLGLASGDTGMVCGFLAQEVQEVFPMAAASYYQPARYDTLGNLLHESVDLLGLKYDEFIPLLVAGFKEQQAAMGAQEALIDGQDETIAALQDQVAAQAEQLSAQAAQLAELQAGLAQLTADQQRVKSQVNNCCGLGGTTGQNESGPAVKDGVALGQNAPNPFEQSTTIAFELPRAAQVRVEISDNAGRVLETLHDGPLEAGPHQMRWDASRYASGVYYYSLYADTVLLTKKMIKR